MGVLASLLGFVGVVLLLLLRWWRWVGALVMHGG